MTVNSNTASGVNAVLSSDILYQFKIDNTGDFAGDQVIQVTCNNLQPDQQFRMVRPRRPAGQIDRADETRRDCAFQRNG